MDRGADPLDHDVSRQSVQLRLEQTRSPAGAIQWKPKDGAGANTIPDAHVEGVSHAPMMFTTDLALKFDPTYREISKRFLDNPEEFELAFAKAWLRADPS